jgi:hypothetical protein
LQLYSPFTFTIELGAVEPFGISIRMPPALSDYSSASASTSDSDSDSNSRLQVVTPIGLEDIPAVRAPLEERHQAEQSTAKLKQSLEENKAGRAVVKVSAFLHHLLPVTDHNQSTGLNKRKRNTLLAGLEQSNIVALADADDEDDQPAARDTPLTSSLPSSSFRTRGQTARMRHTKPLYDQKYHPMDDVVQPARAARHHARYEEQRPAEDSEETDPYTDALSDTDDDTNRKPHTDKRRKPTDLPPSLGTRRSSRQVNHDVLYNTSVHPQDEQIDCMEVDSSQEGTDSGWESDYSQEGEAITDETRVVRDTDGKYNRM